MTRDAETSGTSRPRRRRLRSWITIGAATAVLLGGLAVAVAVPAWRHLASVVDEKFSGRRWDFPSRVYSDEFLLHVGLDVAAARVPRRLERLSYRPSAGEPDAGGEYRDGPGVLEIALRAGALGRRQTQHVRLDLDDGRIAAITDLDTGEPLAVVALEPEELTGIYEGSWEDRRAVRVTDVNPVLIRAILATEDGRFFSHHGVDVNGIGRAALTNLRSGQVEQGASEAGDDSDQHADDEDLEQFHGRVGRLGPGTGVDGVGIIGRCRSGSP